MKFAIAVASVFVALAPSRLPAADGPSARVLVVAAGPDDRYHSPMIEASPPLFEAIARDSGLAIDFTRDPTTLSDANLARYRAIVQLHLAPFDMSPDEQQALARFVRRGGGWVGVHAAGLTGAQFLAKDGAVPYWQWFEDFLGGVVYSPHPALQTGTMVVEDRDHPVTRRLGPRIQVLDEWYEFDRSPRPNVHVLATADESTYKPNKPMGDHPIVWTNPRFDRTVYIAIGHDVSMVADPSFRTLLQDAIVWAAGPRFRVLVLAEKDSLHHKEYVAAAHAWLLDLARRLNFAVDFINDTDGIDDATLAKYRLFVQLDYPPYGWKPAAMAAFKDYMEKGRGGWIGFHHASLLGEFDGHPMWPWYWEMMGKIRFKDYIPTFARGTVHVEDAAHPVMAGVPRTFAIEREEWYTYDRTPRPNVHVLASVDESSYRPRSKVRMGDHPVIWTNDRLPARNLYVFMGHGPELFENAAYATLVQNALFWAAGVSDSPAQ